MRLVDYLDKGASLGSDAPCLTMAGETLGYGEVQSLTYRIARALNGSGITPGKHVAILSENDPMAFATMLSISRAAAVWCPLNPRNEASENGYILDNFDCAALIFQSKFAGMIEQLLPTLAKLKLIICLDAALPFAPSLEAWLDGMAGRHGRCAIPCRTRQRSRDDPRHWRHNRHPQRCHAFQP